VPMHSRRVKMADTTRNEPPRLYIAHHQASRIDHTGVGEYKVTVSIRVEMINAQKEMVHAQFLVDGTAQGYPQLLGDDGRCEQILVLAPATHPQISVMLSWRHDPSPKPIHLCGLDVPSYIDPRERSGLEGMYLRWERRREEERRRRPGPPVRQSWWRKIWS
jgi:hypothetical protein